MSDADAIDDDELTRWLEGELTEKRGAEIEAMLASSTSTRARVDELRSMLETLRRVDPEIAEIDLVPTLDAGIARARSSEQKRRRRSSIVAGLAIAAGALLWFRPSDDLRARGGPGESQPGIQAHHQARNGVVTPIVGPISRSDGLVFSYSRPEGSPYAYLMIFGVDSEGKAHWYYPARRPDAVSIPIKSGHRVELPDVIEEDLPPGPLVIHALFTSDPRAVPEGKVPAAIAEGAIEQRLEIELLP